MQEMNYQAPYINTDDLDNHIEVHIEIIRQYFTKKLSNHSKEKCIKGMIHAIYNYLIQT